MSDEGGEQDLRDTVKRLEATVSALETRLATLEGQGAPRPLSPAAVVTPPPPAPEPRDLEAHVGTYWLSRLGIVALIIGIAYLITYHFGELGVLARVGAGYLLSAGLGGFGLWLARKHQLFGRIVFGGGLALAYFVTYALHFIPAVRVIDSEALALVLLAAFVVAIVTIAHRMQSETVAGIALFLGLHTGMLSDITAFTLLSTTLLAAGALFFLVRNRWVIVPLSSLVAVYSTHVVWAVRTGHMAPGAPEHDRLLLSMGFLSLYFLLFSAALLVRPRDLPLRASLAFTLLNWVGLTSLGAYEVSREQDSRLFAFLLVVALAHGAGAGVARLQRAPVALMHTYLALGAVTLALAMPARYDDVALVAAWTATGLIAGLAARGVGSPVLRGVGVLILFVALAACEWETPGRMTPLLGLGVAFVLVERGGTVRVSGRVEPQVHPLFTAVCAVGAGLSLVALVGARMPSGLVTLGWVIAAFLLFGVGFALRERWYRLAALAVLGLSLARLVLVDVARLPPDQRVLTFILLGVMLLVVSYTYTRLRDRHG
ncbi:MULTISPECIES: DUF2339 domain-containing protein [Corallococcus]|uniref:DUF2339 domain-containing protein n=1 Tax=Corallococcus TaxID=83461 RepID=UPI00117FCC0C|nr:MULTISPECIES: DUF2339 domain-containing protein [Corallococcus]NBD09372.1 DUF2339 domain-containing protein [Corallococcus silvisoli]TSC31333.1 DUF2339 domain-containing protein [Corallococcus sp. Z5C101001]